MRPTLLHGEDDYAREIGELVADCVAPRADEIDREQRIPQEVVRRLAEAGVFASGFPEEHGGPAGSAEDPVAAAVRHGLMHEALGRASASVQGLVNVHHMGGSALARWGTRAQKEEWLPRLTSGEILAAIAITEPEVGSDAAAVETLAVTEGSEVRIDGCKTWITCGQTADLFVLLAGSADGPTAFLLPRDTQGLEIEPIHDMLGCRGYMMATLHLDGCRLSAEHHRLGKAPFGLSHIVATGLDAGRLNLAWGCVGLAQACLDLSLSYAKSRRQFGGPLADRQLIQRMISRMMSRNHAARLMCWHASRRKASKDPAAIKESTMAKYFASTMVQKVAHDALQIHGASGCGPGSPLQRFVRDARIMEIIEGTTQILETAIARYGFQESSRAAS